MRRAPDVILSPAEQSVLEQWAAAQGSSKRLAVRSQIVLEAAGGRTNGEIARLVGTHSETVSRWRNRFVVNRVNGLIRDAPRSGARTQPSSALAARILRATLEDLPPSGDRWTTRSLGRALQVSHMRVHRVWRAHGLSPRGGFVANVSPSQHPELDIVGVHLDQPAAAVVFSVSHTRLRREPLDDRPGVSSAVSGGLLFADQGVVPSALADVLATTEELLPRVRSAGRSPHELLIFLRTVEETSEPASQLHLILDRPMAFLPERVGQWLAAHPRFRVFTSGASSTWTDSVRDWLQTWRSVPLARGSFRGMAEFAEAIARAVGSARPLPRRFSWTLSAGPPRGRQLPSPTLAARGGLASPVSRSTGPNPRGTPRVP